MFFKKTIIMLLPLFSLMGCSQSYTHDFLITHPAQLQSEVKKCEQNGTQIAYCDMVMQTRDEFIDLVNTRGTNAEKFGEELLRQQTLLVEMQQALAKERHTFQNQKAHLTQTEVKATQAKLHQMREAYRSQKLTVGKLSAVISATSSPNL